MTKFTNRIKPDSTELERYFLSVYTGNLWDALEKIKDWHSPEHIEKEVQMKLLKLQQQALPVVPEDVDKAIKYLKKHNNSTFSDLGGILTEKGFSWLNDFQFKDRRFGFGGLNNKLFILSHLAITGYQVEKPQLFYIDLPKVFGLSDSTSDSTFVSKAEGGTISEFTKGKDYALKLTEQEIKSIDERYWQFAVSVEDGE